MQILRKRWRSLILLGLSMIMLTGCGQQIVVLNPHGPVAKEELNLITWSFGLMMFVVVAVFILFAYMLIKYRARPNQNTDYQPEQEGNKLLETIWTIVPIFIIIALAVPTVITTYKLVKPPTKGAPYVVNVTSADWKWLFQYPGQGIETVNYVVIPVNRPIEFQLNAVGPMNSFWVPSLGGMEYSMPGMVMGLWLQADQPGSYVGRSANFSGSGFVHMVFRVLAKDDKSYAAWLKSVKASAPPMTEANYQNLMKESVVPEMTFSSYPKGTFAQNSMSMPMPATKSGNGSSSS